MSGSFEYALDYLIDHQLDLGTLDRRYRNDNTGSTAYDPRVLLKIILLAYKGQEIQPHKQGILDVRASGMNVCVCCQLLRNRNCLAQDGGRPAITRVLIEVSHR